MESTVLSGEPIFDSIEERRAVLADVGLFEFCQLQQQLALFVGHFLRDFDVDFDEQIARSAAAWVGHAAATFAKDLAGVRAGRNVLLLFAVERWDFDLRAKRRLRVGDRDVTDQILAVPFKEVVFSDVDLDVQIAARSAVRAGFTFASQAEGHAGIDTGRDASLQPHFLDLAAGAAAIDALVADDLPFASASGAGRLNAEEALRLHDLAMSFAVVARRGR